MKENITPIIVTLVFTAFFAGIEIAYLTSNKLRIELKNKKGYLGARILTFFIKKPTHFFTTTLVGNNIAVVLYSIYASNLITILLVNHTSIGPDQKNLIFVIQTVVSSIIMLFIGEFLPKAIFRSSPNRLLNFLSIPFLLIYYLLYPLVMLIVFLSSFILRTLFRTEVSTQEPEFTRHDLFSYVSESLPAEDSAAAEVDKEIFKNAIEFASLKVRECMIPRTEIEAVEVTEPIDKVKQLFIESGHSKLLVYRETIDNIIGYVHLVDLYRSPASIDKIVMPIVIATESTPASELLKQLIEKRRSVSVVVDEFGGTSGMATIEDIIEEIIGDIEDEHDVDEFVEKKINDNEYIFSARLEVEYLNEEYDLELPEGDYETLGGLIFYHHQNVPNEGDVITVAPYQFTILSTTQARINEVKLEMAPVNE
jgi:CBS domain containing-hemolysin-like protein